MSARDKILKESVDHQNATFSETVGSIKLDPYQCKNCHKQYASNAKLLQHQRKQHPELQIEPANVSRQSLLGG